MAGLNLPVQQLTDCGYETLFKEYFSSLKAYAQMFVPHQTAEDIVQDLLLYVWENRFKLNIHTSIESYLFKSVYLRCLNNIKSITIKSRHIIQLEIALKQEELSYFNPETNETLKNLFMEDFNVKLNAALEILPPKCREVFKLSFLMEYKNREISEKLNISVNTVESHITNALKILRKKLKLGLFILLVALL